MYPVNHFCRQVADAQDDMHAVAQRQDLAERLAVGRAGEAAVSLLRAGILRAGGVSAAPIRHSLTKIGVSGRMIHRHPVAGSR